MKTKLEQKESPEGDYTCFYLDGEEYGIATQFVTGVQAAPMVRRVPKSPEFIEGVSNIHGRILPIVNTRNRLGSFQTETLQKNTLILTQLDGVFYGLLADQLSGITYLNQKMIEPVNPILVKKETPFIRAMATVDDRLVHLLDLEAFLFSGLDVDRKEKRDYSTFSQKSRESRTYQQKDDHLAHLVIEIGLETYGLSINALRDVLKGSVLEPLSGGPDYLAGIVRTPEGIVPVIDMQKKYRMAAVPYTGLCRIVVVESGRNRFGVLANRASEMVGILPDEIKAPPAAVTGDRASHIKNVAILGQGKRLIILLEKANLLTEKEFQDLSMVEGMEKSQGRTQEKTTRGESVKSFLIFQVADHEFAFDMGCLVEVIPYKRPSRVSKAPSHIRGLITVKGELVPVTDLRLHLDIESEDAAVEKHIIILRESKRIHGIIVDRVTEILQVPEQSLVAPGDFLKGISLDAIESIIRLETSERVPMVLNLEKAVA